MGDGTEQPPDLDAATLKQLAQRVGKCSNRADLDRLTRHTWRLYESAANTAALETGRWILERPDAPTIDLGENYGRAKAALQLLFAAAPER